MKLSERQMFLFRCLFCRNPRDRSPDSDTRELVHSPANRDSNVLEPDSQSNRGFTFSNYGEQKSDLVRDCVDSSSLSFSVSPECNQRTVLPATQPEKPPCLSSRFVFVVAADSDENERLQQQVEAACLQLKTRGIGYVVVSSTNPWPMVCLPKHVLDRLPPQPCDFKSVQKFVWGCYKKAAKVLVLITPGYQRYADAYSEDAEEPKTYQQKLMRKIQERLKQEFFDRKVKFRIWPVILHEMKANRVHLPSFLTSCVFYWFPFKQGVEKMMEVLHKDLSTQSSSVKRSI